jgi:hypothetical protein
MPGKPGTQCGATVEQPETNLARNAGATNGKRKISYAVTDLSIRPAVSTPAQWRGRRNGA